MRIPAVKILKSDSIDHKRDHQRENYKDATEYYRVKLQNNYGRTT